MPIRIIDLRLSFVWTSGTDLLLDDPVPAIPFAFLTSEAGYASRLEELRAAGDPDGLFPWPRHAAKHFWSMYLGGPTAAVSPWTAWKHFVPLRVPLRRPAAVPGLPAQLSLEGFCYPFGVAVVAGVNLYGGGAAGWDPAAAAELAHRCRYDGVYRAARDGGAVQALTLDALAAEALGSIGRAAFGDAFAPAPGAPYGVATFARIAGEPAEAEVTPGGAIHRMLDAVTRWRRGWKDAALPPLEEASIDTAGGTPGNLHYSRDRGRAAWYPARAMDTERGARQLRCYHRNQTLAALQVESVGGFAARTARRLREGRSLSVRHGALARHAAGLLGRVYGRADPSPSARNTYHSYGSRDHMVRRGFAAEVNELRGLFQMPPLH